MADLLTLEELREARGDLPDDNSNDGVYEAVIPLASKLIRQHTDRDFGAPQVTEERIFEYDDSGYLDIDDASAVTAVAITVPGAADLALAPEEWMAMPTRRDDAPVFYYLLLPILRSPGYSPAMGFKRNLDVYFTEGRWNPGLPQMVKVTATWGWPTVPEDVKLAMVWTIEDWLAAPTGGEDLTSESIAGFARSWGNRGQGRQGRALPLRVLDVLALYTKILV